MKRLLGTALLVLALFATACGGGESSDTTESAETTPPTTAETTTQAPTTEAPAEEEVAETDTEAPAEEEAPAGDIDGMAIYESNCTRCHGADGSGGRGPSLQNIVDKVPDPADDVQQILDGGNGMPAFADKLTEAEIDATVLYYRTAFIDAV